MWEACGGRIVYSNRPSRWGTPAGPCVTPPRWNLSAREQQVLELMASGYTPKEIMTETRLSRSGVEARMRAIRFKMRAKTNEQAMVVATRAGLVKTKLATPVHLSEQGDLAPRELQALRLVAEGHTNPEIAQLMMISYETVKTYLNRTRSHFGARTRSQAVALAMREGVLS